MDNVDTMPEQPDPFLPVIVPGIQLMLGQGMKPGILQWPWLF